VADDTWAVSYQMTRRDALEKESNGGKRPEISTTQELVERQGKAKYKCGERNEIPLAPLPRKRRPWQGKKGIKKILGIITKMGSKKIALKEVDHSIDRKFRRGQGEGGRAKGKGKDPGRNFEERGQRLYRGMRLLNFNESLCEKMVRENALNLW